MMRSPKCSSKSEAIEGTKMPKPAKPEIGKTYRVTQGEHRGKIITVNEMHGMLAIALEIDYPFLPGELEPVEKPELKTVSTSRSYGRKIYVNLLKETLTLNMPRHLRDRIEAAVK